MSTVLPYLFLLLLLFFPSSNLQQFNGLPLSHWAEFLALGLLIPFLFSADLRGKADGMWKRLRIPSAVFYAAAGIVLLLKIGQLFLAPLDEFAGCYSSPAAWTQEATGIAPGGACERSYEDLFRRSGATRSDPTINFDPASWNLTFLNSLRYDYPQSDPNAIRRNRIPFDVQWSGAVSSSHAEKIIIRYTGEGKLTVGS